MHKEEKLHITSNRSSLKAFVNVLKAKDRDTSQFIFIVPSLAITSYGETQAKAEFMLQEEIKVFITDLLAMTPGKMKNTLSELGWIKQGLRNNDFSKTYHLDEKVLLEFNIEGKIETMALVA